MTSQARDIAPEDADRAVVYSFVGRLLQAPPTAADLDVIRALAESEGALGEALSALGDAARDTDVAALGQDFQTLFIGLGRGEFVPYGSFYLTGFLNEKPLADLRGDMARLGIARADDVKEPEDHIAALCQCMEGLITGAFGKTADLDEQKRFFDRHIGSWAGHFFKDLKQSQTSTFYSALGALGETLIELETEAFDMTA